MLEEISLDKFKAFSKLENLKIKPLTILCGVNSAGKTSILKSLLLLKQSYENAAATNAVTLNGLYSINGSMKDILHKGKGDKLSIKNKFKIHFHGKRYASTSKQDVSTGKEIGKMIGLNSGQTAYFLIDVAYQVRTKKDNLWDDNFLEKYTVSITPHNSKNEELKEHQFKLSLEYKKGGKYDLCLNNFPTVNKAKTD